MNRPGFVNRSDLALPLIYSSVRKFSKKDSSFFLPGRVGSFARRFPDKGDDQGRQDQGFEESLRFIRARIIASMIRR